MSSSEDDWCLIESDPGVFTELLETLGVQGVELDEVYSLGELSSTSNKIYGLVFLFQYMGKSHAREPLDESAIPPNLFFAHQVTTNACATQAMLSVLMNASSADSNNTLDLGPVLTEFKSFTESFSPQLKGVAISSSETIKAAHNVFRKPDLILSDKVAVSSDEGEAFHFVAYVPHNQVVYELDGLQQGPIVVGTVPDSDDNNNDAAWLEIATAALQERMRQAGDSHIKFNLMAVVQDKRVALRRELESLDESSSPEHVQELQLALEHEQRKRAQYKLENERRRHSYVPLCMQMLKELARQKTLMEFAEQARERDVTRRAAKKNI
ncbi:hypothetical protein MPSEU_000122800 [Mayamaea pseudoterrestris]|nr:hypothetical protein MPSEU_000122800 [Mayamaea pseudoterrestris]